MLVGLALVAVTGAEWLDPVVALVVAAAIVRAGVRILSAPRACSSTRRCPTTSSSAIRAAVIEFAPRGVVGYHKLRAPPAGARRYVDLHVQFRAGTTLEEAHETAHRLQDAIRARLGGADVLIHLEPEDRVRPGQEVTTGERPERSAQVDRRRRADREDDPRVALVARRAAGPRRDRQTRR